MTQTESDFYPNILMEDVMSAVQMLRPKYRFIDRIEVNKKQHHQLLESIERKPAVDDKVIATLYGIEIRVHPYIKKMRIYYDTP